MLVIGHLSDTHLGHGSGGSGRALERTRRVMGFLRRCRLGVILVTGDVTDHGLGAEYEQAAAELTAEVPVLLLPGNHDADYPFPVNVARRVGGAVFLLCDSSIPGRDEGLLSAETLAWLAEQLSSADEPAFVCLHHPPVRLHQPQVDSIMLERAERLAEIVEAHPHVVAVLCGHAHAAAATTFAGRPLLVAPGTVSTLRLPWTTDEELTWDNVADLDDVPQVAFHVLDDDGRLTTHYRNVIY
jgi:3',5'-cyclic AMP phosphodiesterase CpdA